MTRTACLSPFQIPFYTMNLHTKTQNEGINVQFQYIFVLIKESHWNPFEL